MNTEFDEQVLDYLCLGSDGIELLESQKKLKSCTMQQLLGYIVSSYIKEQIDGK